MREYENIEVIKLRIYDLLIYIFKIPNSLQTIKNLFSFRKILIQKYTATRGYEL